MPQSIVSSEGIVLDIDVVLNEIIKDNGEVKVEYSGGPKAFTARWEGRPATPPFKWTGGEIEQAAHDYWLQEMDLSHYKAEELVDESLARTGESAIKNDLEATKDVLIQYAGQLQCVFNWYESKYDTSADMVGYMTMADLRDLMEDIKVTSEEFPIAMIDESFKESVSMLNHANAMLQKPKHIDTKRLGFKGFLLAITVIACDKFRLGAEGTNWGFAELNAKISHLCTDYIFPTVLPKLEEMMADLNQAFTPNTEILLERGKRLMIATLDTCLYKRAPGQAKHVKLVNLCKHLEDWKILNHGVSIPQIQLAAMFAEHPEPQLMDAKLDEIPNIVFFEEFERFILAVSFMRYQNAEARESMPFDEYFGEMLDHIFRSSGVLKSSGADLT